MGERWVVFDFDGVHFTGTKLNWFPLAGANSANNYRTALPVLPQFVRGDSQCSISINCQHQLSPEHAFPSCDLRPTSPGYYAVHQVSRSIYPNVTTPQGQISLGAIPGRPGSGRSPLCPIHRPAVIRVESNGVRDTATRRGGSVQ